MAPDSDEWEEDDDEPMQEDKPKSKKAKKEEQPQIQKPAIWNESKEPLKEDEELEFDSNAYQMLHRA